MVRLEGTVAENKTVVLAPFKGLIPDTFDIIV
jgi:hypothetical protein